MRSVQKVLESAEIAPQIPDKVRLPHLRYRNNRL